MLQGHPWLSGGHKEKQPGAFFFVEALTLNHGEKRYNTALYTYKNRLGYSQEVSSAQIFQTGRWLHPRGGTSQIKCSLLLDAMKNGKGWTFNRDLSC